MKPGYTTFIVPHFPILISFKLTDTILIKPQQVSPEATEYYPATSSSPLNFAFQLIPLNPWKQLSLTTSGFIYVISLYRPNQLFYLIYLSTIRSFCENQPAPPNWWSLIFGGNLNARYTSWLDSYVNNYNRQLRYWLTSNPTARNITHFSPVVPTYNVRNYYSYLDHFLNSNNINVNPNLNTFPFLETLPGISDHWYHYP